MPEPTGGTRRWYLWLVVSVVVVAADQATKAVIVEQFVLYERQAILPFLDLVRLHNTGAAFSLLAGMSGWQTWLFTGIAVVVSAAIVWWLEHIPAGHVVLPLGLALILGGAVGNVIDRLTYGYVVDFILLHYGPFSYPAFNVADSAITCGVVLLLWDGIVLERRRAESTSASSGQ